MQRPPLICYLILLLFYAVPTQAQFDTPTQQQIRVLEQLQSQAALDWALDNNSPLRYTTADGMTIEIIDVVEGHPVFYSTLNQRAGQLVRANNLHPETNNTLSLTGRGIRVGIWDAGAVLIDHQELKNRSTLEDLSDPSNHSTHVAGTLVASGITPEARGMAPNARLHSYNWNFHASEMQVAARDGILVSNHSYGKISGWHLIEVAQDSSLWHWFGNPFLSETEDYAFGFYDHTASLFDYVVFDFPHFLPVVAAGNEADDYGPTSGPYKALDENGRWQLYDMADRPIPPDGGPDGFDSITSFALSKNVLTVGSIGWPSDNSNFTVSTFSGKGPTDDGRIKPDIVAPGEQIFSSIAAGATEYAFYTGTSMATPTVAGSLLLLQELAKRQRTTPLRAATLKGLVLHTARDLGPPGPDFSYGWGLLDVEAAAHLLERSFRTPSILQELQIENGDTLETELLVAQKGPARITISWTDLSHQVRPNGSRDLALNDDSPILLNDLDMRLIHQASGDVFYPYVLNKQLPYQEADTGDNTVDPIEQIYISDAEAGLYTLKIFHKENLIDNNSQSVTSIYSGIEEVFSPVVVDTTRTEAELGRVSIQWETLFESAAGSFEIERADVLPPEIAGALSLRFTSLAEVASHGTSNARQYYEFVDENYLTGTYRYRILFVNAANQTRMLVSEVNLDIPTPEALEIRSIYPNPFTDFARLEFDLPAPNKVILSMHDVLGRTMSLDNMSRLAAGRHIVPIDASSWAPGVYFARIIAGERQRIRRVVVF